MAHSLSPVTPPPTANPFSSTFSRKTTHLPNPGLHKIRSCIQVPEEKHAQRRTISLGLAGVMLGLSVAGDENIAKAAGRRPPPPPPGEKKDPNVSGVMAKVLASKKRKEAMKESIAKLRERGKAIEEPSQ